MPRTKKKKEKTDLRYRKGDLPYLEEKLSNCKNSWLPASAGGTISTTEVFLNKRLIKKTAWNNTDMVDLFSEASW